MDGGGMDGGRLKEEGEKKARDKQGLRVGEGKGQCGVGGHREGGQIMEKDEMETKKRGRQVEKRREVIEPGRMRDNGVN